MTKTNEEIIEEFHGLEKSLPTDGLICPVCRNVYPIDIYKLNLSCKKDNCDGIVVSALGFAKIQFKNFLNKALEAKDKAHREEMIEFVESINYIFDHFSHSQFEYWRAEKLTQLKND